MTAYLLISKAEIHNANAMSSTLTIGVPAMTAWLGAAHALERSITAQNGLQAVRIPKIAVSYHQTDLQVYRGRRNLENFVISTSNPLKANSDRPSFIPTPRIHLTVSLLMEVEGINIDTEDIFKHAVKKQVLRMKFAGGDLLKFDAIRILYTDEEDERSERNVIVALMPGSVIIERRDLLLGDEESNEDNLDSLLQYLAIQNEAKLDDDGKVLEWEQHKKAPGWLVPIAVGFKGLSPLGKVKNQRNSKMPHRFVEPVVTLGEFKMPYRFTDIDEMMWHYEYEEEQQLYLCKNQ